MDGKLHRIDIEIDELTNSIENIFSGDRFDTELTLISKDDLQSVKKGNGWQFGWKIEHYERTLGAVHVGEHKIIIFPKEALQLIKEYFKV